jgi:hypothetical protein
MRINRRCLRISLILLVLPLIFALYARAAGDGECKETKYRWDIVHISTFSPVTAFEGGFASALANNGSKIAVTGHGTFEPLEPDEVTGGGTWTTFAPDGTTATGSGTYLVTQLVRFDVAPGVQTEGVIDNIPGAIGDLTDQRAGLLFVKIAYSDGSRGVLVVSCHLNGGPDFVARPASPASIFGGTRPLSSTPMPAVAMSNSITPAAAWFSGSRNGAQTGRSPNSSLLLSTGAIA